MSKSKKILDPLRDTRELAMLLAIMVRNAMENFHHEHLSDKQMKELNPIIRNAICTGLHAMEHYGHSEGARAFVDHHRIMIPPYWEDPELLAGFVQTVKKLDARE